MGYVYLPIHQALGASSLIFVVQNDPSPYHIFQKAFCFFWFSFDVWGTHAYGFELNALKNGSRIRVHTAYSELCYNSCLAVSSV